MPETRLDRIEKNLEMFFQGLSELRASQEKIGERLDKSDSDVRAAQLKTDEQIAEFFQGLSESRISQDKLTENIDKMSSDIRAVSEVRISQDKLTENIDKMSSDIRAAQLKTDKQIANLRAAQEETERKLRVIGKQLGDIGLVQGEIAEDLFYRNVRNLFHDRHPRFKKVRLNLKRKGIAEYDIVAANKGEVLVIEVKNKLSKRMVDTFVDKKLPMFRKAFPDYRDFRILGGVGALVLKDEVGKHAQKVGLYVLTQNNEGGASLFNKDDFKPKAF